MRDNDATGRIVEGPPSAFWIGLSRGLRLSAIALGVGLVMAAGPVKPLHCQSAAYTLLL